MHFVVDECAILAYNGIKTTREDTHMKVECLQDMLHYGLGIITTFKKGDIIDVADKAHYEPHELTPYDAACYRYARKVKVVEA